MPDVVQTYVTTHDVGKVIQLQRSILELYRQDISKYSESTEKIKIKAIFDSIASQLDDKNRRFFLNRSDENGRMNRYGNAFLWLSDAGVALPSYNVTEPQPPCSLTRNEICSSYSWEIQDFCVLPVWRIFNSNSYREIWT